MENYTTKFFIREGYLEVECLGVWLSVDDVVSYSEKVVQACLENDLKIALMDQNLLYISLTDKEVEELMKRLEIEVNESFNLRFIALQSSDGGREQRLFEQLSGNVGFKFELFNLKEEAIGRVEELKLLTD